MRSPVDRPLLTLGLLLVGVHSVLGQVPFPGQCIENQNWTSGTETIAITPAVNSPCDPNSPTDATGTSQVEFISGTEVRLKDGFRAGDHSGNGYFRAHTDLTLGNGEDVVVIAPDPVTHITDDVLHVNKWEKLEIGIKLPQEYQDAIDSFFDNYYPNAPSDHTSDPSNTDPLHDLNPYADDSLQLVMTLTDPNGDTHMKWGFFMREAQWASSAGTAVLVESSSAPLHPYNIRFRIAPDEEGTWSFDVSIKAPHTSTPGGAALQDINYTGYRFLCDPPLSDNHGYLQVNQTNKRTLKFEDGTPFFGLGTNLADKRRIHQWWDSSWYTFYQRDMMNFTEAMDKSSSAGGNFFRMFMLRHFFAPEWVNLGVYDSYTVPPNCDNGTGLDYASSCQYQCWAFDQVLDHAREKGIYLQVCVDPYPPIVGLEHLWGNHPYLIHFIEPGRTMGAAYDMKEFFYTHDSNGVPSVDDGVMYYWKRKYKYIMSRWGYSVNLAVVEPFNETDQLLTYYYSDETGDNNLCPENMIVWQQDMDIPSTLHDWLTDLLTYVKAPVDLSDPAGSPLGEDNKLFLLSYTGGQPYSNTTYYQPFNNPNVDLIDVHMYLDDQGSELRDASILSKDFRDQYQVGGSKKPFNLGEFASPGGIQDQSIGHYETYKIFHNYDVSFHNELWASTFYGNFSTGLTWFWERVFWWPNALPPAPPDNVVNNPFQQTFSNILGDPNSLNIGSPMIPVRHDVHNKSVVHNIKPLRDFLTNSNWLGLNFFDQDFTPQYHYDAQQGIECYYLQSDDGMTAIGWVHNVNAYWNNSYYLKADNHNFLGCTTPNLSPQEVELTGFVAGMDYHVSFFPTRMNSTIYPSDYPYTSSAGEVPLDLSTEPLGGISSNYLDTLHSDYAFIVAQQFVPKNLNAILDEMKVEGSWDFRILPNPGRELVYLMFNDVGAPKSIVMYDLRGKIVFNEEGVTKGRYPLRLDQLAKGPYAVRVSDGKDTKMRTLIVQRAWAD